MRSYIIIPVHNRKKVTLNIFNHMDKQGILSHFHVILVDDGSTDGTAQSILENYPHTIILQGDGNLFWTGAMELGMRHAMKLGADCCVWLNDDLEFSHGTLDSIVSLALEKQAIVSGQGKIERQGQTPWFFPGLYRNESKSKLEARQLDVESTEPVPVDTCRGNCVAIPSSAIHKIGYPDGTNIPHVGGDSDYGLRATAAGISCLTLVSAIFLEKEDIRNDNRSWLLGKKGVISIWKSSISKRGNLYPRMVWTYNLRHWGIRGLVKIIEVYAKLIIITALKLTIPRKILLQIYSTRSHSYQCYAGQAEESP